VIPGINRHDKSAMKAFGLSLSAYFKRFWVALAIVAVCRRGGCTVVPNAIALSNMHRCPIRVAILTGP